MTHFTPGLIVEVLLLVLLCATVGYCMVLNSRLSRLRSTQDELREIIADLGTATDSAENAIRGLKATTDEADAKLTDKLHKAHLLTRELSVLTDARPVERPQRMPEPVTPPPAQSNVRAQPDPEQWRQIALARLKKAG